MSVVIEVKTVTVGRRPKDAFVDERNCSERSLTLLMNVLNVSRMATLMSVLKRSPRTRISGPVTFIIDDFNASALDAKMDENERLGENQRDELGKIARFIQPIGS